MPDFFPPNRELTIEEIVKLTGAKPRPDTPLDRRIRDIAPLDRARSTDITFLDNPKYLDALATTRAGVCLTAPRFAAQAPEKLARMQDAREHISPVKTCPLVPVRNWGTAMPERLISADSHVRITADSVRERLTAKVAAQYDDALKALAAEEDELRGGQSFGLGNFNLEGARDPGYWEPNAWMHHAL